MALLGMVFAGRQDEASELVRSVVLAPHPPMI
jgi:hypothetical protein